MRNLSFLHLINMGFENLKQQHVKYLEDKMKKKDKAIDQSMIENLKFMSIEEWERVLVKRKLESE